MASAKPRRRASTLKAPEPEVTELKNQLAILSYDATGGGITEESQYGSKISVGHRVRQSLQNDSSNGYLKDAFRHLQGFQTVVAAVRTLTAFHGTDGSSNPPKSLYLELLQTLFSILSSALSDHRGNQRYFAHGLKESGWVTLGGILQELSSIESPDTAPKDADFYDRMFGCLLGCALEDDSVIDLFSRIRRRCKPTNDAQEVDAAANTGSNVTRKLVSSDQSNSDDMISNILGSGISSSARVHQPQALLLAMKLWLHLKREHDDDGEASFQPPSIGVLHAISRVTTLSTHNLNALHEDGFLGQILPYLIDKHTRTSSVERQLLFLSKALLELGVAFLEEACLLYQQARSVPLFADLVLDALRRSRMPAYVHFDLSLHGYSSVELPGMGRPFPPQGQSSGYTLSMWFQVVQFDAESHTTLFGAFDAGQTCFVLIYIEKDTRNLILQTSVTSSRPSVRFKSTAFKPHCWYHLVITHQRPKTTSSSRASLFINGEFAEQVKSQYPAGIDPPGKKYASIDPTAFQKHGQNAVQAFFGTPRDLATRLGKGVVSTQWRLASAHLFSDVLTDDLISVYYQLGPRYAGNFQDCLGSFQTYKASARLNIRNESLHPGKEDKSDIISAIRSKAGLLLPEHLIMLNISATVVLDDNDTNNINESRMIKCLSKAAAKNLWNVTRGGQNALAINGAIPSINDALLQSSGFAVLTGDPCTVVPGSMDEAAWRAAGCAPVGLALLEAAQSPEGILRALEITLESVQGSWRNSEAMERENGFGALATLLTHKLENRIESSIEFSPVSTPSPQPKQRDSSLDRRILNAILEFVGFRPEKPEESVINNPLAYRILIVDMQSWKLSSPVIQKIYYEQFVAFSSRSKYRHFNLKRLLRMRLLKRWLESLKSDPFTEETLMYFMDAFRFLFERGINAELMRSLSLYITYAIHKPALRELRTARSKSIKSKASTPIRRKTASSISPNPSIDGDSAQPTLTQVQIASRLLQLYADLLCQADNVVNIQKFARTVTNKWLLYLLADDEPSVVALAMKILARLLVVSGPSYMAKYIDKTGGAVLMENRLKRWWQIPAIWVSCFAILFGADVAKMDFSRPFDLFNLIELFVQDNQVAIVYAAVLPVLTGMLQSALKDLNDTLLSKDPLHTKQRTGAESPSRHGNETSTQNGSKPKGLSLKIPLQGQPPRSEERVAESELLVRTVIRFLSDIHARCAAFRDFAASSTYVQEFFAVLFPVVIRSPGLSPSRELQSPDPIQPYSHSSSIVQPLSMKSTNPIATDIVTVSGEDHELKVSRQRAPRRMSSFIIVSSDDLKGSVSDSNTEDAQSALSKHVLYGADVLLVQEVLELTIAVFIDQIFVRKDFPGLGLFLRVPSASLKDQALFETYILRNTISHFTNHIKLNQKLLWEPRVLTNLARFATHLAEAIYEGWFANGAEDAMEFLADILEYLQLPQIASIKNVRLCSHMITNMRTVLLRIVLLRLSELENASPVAPIVTFLERLAYWQVVLQPTDDIQNDLFNLLCLELFGALMSTDARISAAATNLWRMLIVQKPEEILSNLQKGATAGNESLIGGFRKIMELDNEVFLEWVKDHRQSLEDTIFNKLSKAWMAFVANENMKTHETAKARVAKRRERLRRWESQENSSDEIFHRHEISTEHWRANIFAAEDLKRQRNLQDQQDNQVFNNSTWSRMKQLLQRPCGLFEEPNPVRWQLDLTEGRNRMRMRLTPDLKGHLQEFQPKRHQSQGPSRSRRSTGIGEKSSPGNLPPARINSQPLDNNNISDGLDSALTPAGATSGDGTQDTEREDDFEIVDSPEEEPEFEDKNRKVMRSLQRGDQVEHVHNVARIVGLEAIEGLLILGKSHLYLLDNLFQRSDGEVVNSWQAPQEERDAYLLMISGRKADMRSSSSVKADFETRCWRWDDVLSISKRRFLFRDVALELFFVDGRSYLLTASMPPLRDELYQKLLAMTPNSSDRISATGNDRWRVDFLRNPSEETQNLGSKFTSVFTSASANPATRKWMKGEVSNFHYLMLINTMAGRTFNDLTQYPVFPWVLADYTSEELDLSDPKTFRDLRKPMGCQSVERQAEFMDRYKSFAEMGDQNAQPFHYGTHYSSAMIVTSYLIRLQPFVQSYLLLQGGAFDHPDRLFYSIEKAWKSASRDSMTDVRELIPEFFYLPDFLTNINDYNFGTRQADGGAVNDVTLPPWAKGDPKIFIAKNREALESDYVTRHLQDWIDLVFGQKQRGESALEATNVFHYLSYHGAKDLDTIEDPVERLATIGIIHNFGQTPHQIFQRPHPPQEEQKVKARLLDSAAENLTRLPFPISESHERISSLQWSLKHERLFSAGAFRVDIGPFFDKYLLWGFVDDSVRFYATENKKLIGLFEHVHQGQLTCALFADSKTLITAGSDCTVSVWTVISSSRSVDLQPRKTLFGHRQPVSVIAISRSFSALLSASSDGTAILWDLNRLELVRILTQGASVECAQIHEMTGTIMLCRGSEISIWTLNGGLMLKQDIFVEGEDQIHSCAFYEGSGNEYLERNLIFTGQRRGVVNVWNVAIRRGSFVLEHIKSMHHLDQAGFNVGAAITAILPMAQTVYTGDDDGRVYEWDCIQRQ